MWDILGVIYEDTGFHMATCVNDKTSEKVYYVSDGNAVMGLFIMRSSLDTPLHVGDRGLWLL